MPPTAALLATFGDLFGQPLTLREMSPYLPKAVIATEDRRFYSHFGVDPIGLAARRRRQSDGRPCRPGRQYDHPAARQEPVSDTGAQPARKIRETLLALWLEHRFTKDEILEIYLNRVYLGAGTYGVDAAAHRYFGKSARHTNLYESAAIAGLLKAPTKFNPTRDREKAAARTARVLANMVEAGIVSESQVAECRQRGDVAPRRRRRPVGCPLFRRLDRRAAQRFCRCRQSRPHRHDDARYRTAGRGRGGRRRDHRARRAQGGGQPRGARGDVAGWRGARHGRRPRLRREPVQSGDAGATPAGFRLQAVRLSRGARGGLAALGPVRRRADPHRQLAAARLYRPLSGRDDPGGRAGAVDQHDRGAGRATRRHPQSHRGGASARHFLRARAGDEPGARHQRGEPARAGLGLCTLRQWRHRGVAARHRRNPRQRRQSGLPPYRLRCRVGS